MIQILAIVPGDQYEADGKNVREYFIAAAIAGLADGFVECHMVEALDPQTQVEGLDGDCDFTGSIARSQPGTVEITVDGTCQGGLTGTCDGGFHAEPETATDGLAALEWLEATFIVPIHAPHTIVYRAQSHFED